VKLEAGAVGVTADSREVPGRKDLSQETIIIIIINSKLYSLPYTTSTATYRYSVYSAHLHIFQVVTEK
jgi:hypothetical protein